jgi:uncharacterized DUF497 family protein
MIIEYDHAKRETTLKNRGLDFANAADVFSGNYFTGSDIRLNYHEPRFVSVGYLDSRLVVLVWTPRGEVRRIISMRKANAREKAIFAKDLDR